MKVLAYLLLAGRSGRDMSDIESKVIKIFPTFGETQGAEVDTWQHGVVSMVRRDAFRKSLSRIVKSTVDPGGSADILIDAMSNYFSYRNPGFGENWWRFRKTGTVFHIARDGVYFDNEDAAAGVEHITKLLAEAIGRNLWARTFLYPYPTQDIP